MRTALDVHQVLASVAAHLSGENHESRGGLHALQVYGLAGAQPFHAQVLSASIHQLLRLKQA